MSSSPQHSSPRQTPHADGGPQQKRRGTNGPADPASALVFDDPLAVTSSDDTDRGWGEGASGGYGGDGSAADLARFLEEKPPHHL